MKKWICGMLSALALGLLGSCANEENLDPVGQWTMTTAQPVAPAAGFTQQLSEEGTTPMEFKWDAATSSAGYRVSYRWELRAPGKPEVWLQKNTTANKLTFTHSELDKALSAAGLDVSETAALEWVVVATCMDRQQPSVARPISLTRAASELLPEALYLAGAATEVGDVPAKGLLFRALKDKDGALDQRFEIYTRLEAGKGFLLYGAPSADAIRFGTEGGKLKKNGAPFTVAETGTYRMRLDLKDGSYAFQKVDKWSVVGNVIAGGWGGDAPLTYQGKGIWQASLMLSASNEADPLNYIFRMNGDWGWLLKHLKGTSNELVMESEAQAGTFEDLLLPQAGRYIVTLKLAGPAYTYTVEKDNSIQPPASTPESLFLLSDGEVVGTFTKKDATFKSVGYLALQGSKTYVLNTKEDGTGQSYSLAKAIGETASPEADQVEGNDTFGEGGAGTIAVVRDQAYQLEFNFATGAAKWKHYNIKLFHWSNWDDRDELPMTYEHPYTFKLSAPLKAGYDMKFNSPWEVELGAENATALSGKLINKGGSNIKCIATDGTYNVTITVTPDYAEGTYGFQVK